MRRSDRLPPERVTVNVAVRSSVTPVRSASASVAAMVTVGCRAGRATNDIIGGRYTADGSLDTTFSTDGKAYADFGGSDEGEDMALDANGRIVVIGSKANADMIVARFDTSGSLETGFDTDGKVTVDFGNASEEGE